MQTAMVQWIGDEKFVATSPSGHAITIDSDRASNKAPGPMELVLMALGACTATDVVSILKKKRQKLESLEVICSGERATETSHRLDKTGNSLSAARRAGRSRGESAPSNSASKNTALFPRCCKRLQH